MGGTTQWSGWTGATPVYCGPRHVRSVLVINLNISIIHFKRLTFVFIKLDVTLKFLSDMNVGYNNYILPREQRGLCQKHKLE